MGVALNVGVVFVILNLGLYLNKFTLTSIYNCKSVYRDRLCIFGSLNRFKFKF